jgi:hypothetical protein
MAPRWPFSLTATAHMLVIAESKSGTRIREITGGETNVT